MRAKNLKIEFETALRKTLMMMNANGNKAAVKVWNSQTHDSSNTSSFYSLVFWYAVLLRVEGLFNLED
jgi:hypothetical protein